MAGYYTSFDLAIIDAAGYRQPAGGLDVDVYNVTQSSSLGNLTADDEGIVAEGSFAADPLDVVEFSVAGFTLTFRQILQETQAKAYLAVENSVNTFIIQNLYDLTNDSQRADVYLQDLDTPKTPLKKIASIDAGTEIIIPYVVTAQKSVRLGIISNDVTGQRSDSAFETMESFNLTIPGPSGASIASLFDRYADAATAGTTRETLYSDSIAASTLKGDGDKMTANYTGTLAANANNKRLIVSFAGTDIVDTGNFASNNVPWSVDVSIIRVSNTTVRANVNVSVFGVAPYVGYAEIASLNLSTTAYDLELDAVTPTASGDVTARLGNALYIPKRPQAAFGTQLGGFSLSFTPGEITGLPFEAKLGGFYLTFTPGDVRHYVYGGVVLPDDWTDLELDPPEA